MLNLIGLNIGHHCGGKIRKHPSTVCGILLMIVSSLILYSFIRPVTAFATSSLDYSTLTEWKSVDAYAPVISVAFSPDQSMIAGGLDGRIEIYNDKLELIKELKASENKKPSSEVQPLGASSTEHCWMMALAFSPDSKLIAAACYDGTVRIWDVKTGAETICKDAKLAYDEWTARSHKGPVRSIAFSPDSSKIVSGGDDKAVKMWDVKFGKLLWDGEEHVYRVVTVAFSVDGSSVSSLGAKDIGTYDSIGNGGGEFKIWDANTGQLKQSNTIDNFASTGAGLSPDGKIAICNSNSTQFSSNAINIWDFKTGVLTYSVGGGDHSPILAFSSDSTCVVTGFPQSANRTAYGKQNTSIEVLSLQDGQSLIKETPINMYTHSSTLSYISTASYVMGIAISKDNRSLAFGCKDGTIEIWRVP